MVLNLRTFYFIIFIDNNIKHCFSKPYTPKSAGAVEATHKQIKKLVFDQFYTLDKEDFYLEDALLNAVDFHNNYKHSITLFKPVDIRDTKDNNIIKIVNENIKKNISRVLKYKDLYLLEDGEYILVSDNIKVKKIKRNIDEIIIADKKHKSHFIIPAKFIKYTNTYKLHIKIIKQYKNIVLKNMEYLIEASLIREVTEICYNYYL